jgi:hypothetical protein
MLGKVYMRAELKPQMRVIVNPGHHILAVYL